MKANLDLHDVGEILVALAGRGGNGKKKKLTQGKKRNRNLGGPDQGRFIRAGWVGGLHFSVHKGEKWKWSWQPGVIKGGRIRITRSGDAAEMDRKGLNYLVNRLQTKIPVEAKSGVTGQTEVFCEGKGGGGSNKINLAEGVRFGRSMGSQWEANR